MDNPDRVRLSDVEFDMRTGELWRNETRTVLPQQLFRILVMLVRARGSLVSREDLHRALWHDATAGDFENGLNAAIKRLREALGDSASAPRFIETIPRRGYRLTVPLGHTAPAAGAPATPPRARSRMALSAIVVITLIAAAIVLYRLGSRPRNTQAANARPELVRLTSTSGLNIDPAFSVDGSRLAYASDSAGKTGLDIWVHDFSTGAARRLTTDDGDEAEPAFSPDGNTIVYAKREAGGIAVVSAAGGASRMLVHVARARTPRFSPDGRSILYWTGLPIWSPLSRGVPHAAGALEVVAASGGRPKSIAAGFASARYGVWSPDGKHVLFLGERERDDPEGGLDWYLAPIEGDEPVRTGALAVLRDAGVAGIPVPGEWSADGDAVVFASAGEGESNVWQVRIARDTGAVVASPERLTLGTAIERSPAGAPARRVAFASLVENVDIWRIPLDASSGLASGPLERVTDNPARDRMMNVSADGRWLAFVSSRGGRDAAWVRDTVQGTERQIASEELFSARISRDGSLLAVNRTTPRRESVVVPIGGASRPAPCDDCEIFDWAADGRMLLGRGTPVQLFVRDRSGRDVALAHHPAWNLVHARFSPDGRWVVFQTTNTPTLRQIFVVPAHSMALPFERWTPVVSDFGIQPSWSSNNGGIYHFSFRDGVFCAWLQRLDPATMRPSGDPVAVQHLHEPRLRAVTGAIVTNDVRGGYLYLTLTETTANIWTMTRAGAR